MAKNKLTYMPTFNRLLVEPLDEIKNGLIRIENHIYGHGKVVAVGPMAGKRDENQYHYYKVGDMVVYQKSALLTVKINDDEFSLINDDLVLTVTPA